MRPDVRFVKQHLVSVGGSVLAQLADIERQKAALFQQGVQASSRRMQTILARRIRDLDCRAKALECSLQIIHKQNLILTHLVYARENDDALNQGLLGRVDWNSLLTFAETNIVAQKRYEEKLNAVLELLGESPSRLNANAAADATSEQKTLPVKRDAAMSALVKHVPDGDGLELGDGTRVRYIGIDAPEISGHDGKPEPFALEAREMNRQLVMGKRVRLERDTLDTDRYGRLLRYVFVDNIFVNAELVRAGLATVLMLAPNEKYANDFLKLQAQAEQAQKGIWQKI